MKARQHEIGSPANVTLYKNGIIGNDSPAAFRLSGTYLLPKGISFAGTLISNTGYPYVSTYSVTRAAALAAAVALTRASQTVPLSQRGDERYPNVTAIDLRVSRKFKFAGRSFEPTLDLFNVGNASPVVNLNTAVGSTYLKPSEILAPRIIRLGFSFNF